MCNIFFCADFFDALSDLFVCKIHGFSPRLNTIIGMRRNQASYANYMKVKFIYKIDTRNKTAYNEIAEKQSQAEGGGKHGRKSELRKDAAVYGEKC